MIMVGIKVCCNNNLKPVTPYFLSQFDSDLMSLFCSNLALTLEKSLITVISKSSIGFAPVPFGVHEFIQGSVRIAVDPGNIHHLFSFLGIHGVVDNITDSLSGSNSFRAELRLCGSLLRVNDIVDCSSNVGFNCPDRCYCH